jgi:hypothetical protein
MESGPNKKRRYRRPPLTEYEKKLIRAKKYGSEKMVKKYLSKTMEFKNFGMGCNTSSFKRFGLGLL